MGTGFAATASALAAAGGTLVGGILVGTGAALTVAYCTDDLIEGLKGEFDLPTILYTPYMIFSNQIPLFDINFFSPMESVFDGEGTETIFSFKLKEGEMLSDTEIKKILLSFDYILLNDEIAGVEAEEKAKIKELKDAGMSDEAIQAFIETDSWLTSVNKSKELQEFEQIKNSINKKINNLNEGEEVEIGKITQFSGNVTIYLRLEENENVILKTKTVNPDKSVKETVMASMQGKENIDFLIIEFLGAARGNVISTEMLRFAKLKILNLMENGGGEFEIGNDLENMLNPYQILVIKDVTGEFNVFVLKTTSNWEFREYESSAYILRGAVSGIYKTLRTLAIVALLTILVYVGIRMVLTSVSKEKAKYKQMLADWAIALLLVFVLHYLMSFVINVTQELTKLVDGSSIENVMLQIPNGTKISNANGELERLDGGDDENADFWATNFIGSIRFYAGLVQNKGYTVKGISYTIMYVVLVIYMVIFTFQYIRRVLYMAFLTMIAPLVAITYPLDKLNDGKAQGFSMWLKEYIFNALLQPIHCIIYVIVVGTIMQLVVKYPLYALVALGFMTKAEQFIRKLFGFEKASTVGGFGVAAGTAALMAGIQKLTHIPRPRMNYKNEETQKLNNMNSNHKIKTIDSIPTIGENNSDTSNKSHGRSRNFNSSSNYGIKETYDDPNTYKFKNSNRFVNGVISLTGHYGRRLNSSMRNRHPIRALRRGLTYGIGAATLGAFGLAAGIASGDPSKALQYTMAGGMAGGNLGRNIGDVASNTIGIGDAANAFKSGALGDRYDEKERMKYNRDFKNNVSNYDYATRKVNVDGWKEMSENGGIIDSALDYGINDIGEMCSIYKTQQKLIQNGMGKDRAKEAAFRAYKLNSEFGDYSSNSKTQENLNKILDSKGYSSNVKEKTKQEILDLIKIYKNASLN